MKTLIKTMLVAFTVIAITIDVNAKPRRDNRGRHRHGRPVVIIPPRPVVCAPTPVVAVYPAVHQHRQPRWVPAHWAVGRFGERVWIKGHYE